MQEHGRADPHRRPADRGHHRFAELEQRTHELEDFAAVQIAGRGRDKIGDIVATGKTLLAASDQQRAHAFILIGLVQRLGHGTVHSASQGIFLIQTVQTQGQ